LRHKTIGYQAGKDMAQAIIKPTFERNDDRGIFRELINIGNWESLANGQMRPGAVMGNHYHKRTQVYFHLLQGSARIRTVRVDTGERDEFLLNANQGVILVANESHAIEFLEESQFLMLKSRRFDAADPDTYHFDVLGNSGK
jgi:dTDP-4-dehydrorhamnose 3,5-epimerase-like enzyme